MHRRSFVIGLLVFCTGCATVLNGGTELVRFESVPDSAELYVNGDTRGETPTTVLLDPSKSYTITFRKQGCSNEVRSLSTHASAGWVAADIVLGLLPVAVDAATGAWSSFDNKDVVARLACTEE